MSGVAVVSVARPRVRRDLRFAPCRPPRPVPRSAPAPPRGPQPPPRGPHLALGAVSLDPFSLALSSCLGALLGDTRARKCYPRPFTSKRFARHITGSRDEGDTTGAGAEMRTKAEAAPQTTAASPKTNRRTSPLNQPRLKPLAVNDWTRK